MRARTSLGQEGHTVFEAAQRQGVHLAVHQLPRDGNRLGVLPFILGDRINPDALFLGFPEPAHPELSRLFIPVLHRATGLHDFVG